MKKTHQNNNNKKPNKTVIQNEEGLKTLIRYDFPKTRVLHGIKIAHKSQLAELCL